jgi:hypothetical protein
MNIAVPIVLSLIVVVGPVVFFRSCSRFNQSPPTITEGEFPFRFVYELNGEPHEIEDTIICKYEGLASVIKSRTWSTGLKGEGLKSSSGEITLLTDENVTSILTPFRTNTEIEVFLYLGSGGYYMGDKEQTYNFTYGSPQVWYQENYNDLFGSSKFKRTPLTEEQLEEHFGIEILEFTFSKPIANTFEP